MGWLGWPLLRTSSEHILIVRAAWARRLAQPPHAPHPCRCLCRGFSHKTRTTPRRRITRHFEQIGLTDDFTFMASPSSEW